jgi:DNA-binding helix-hairpin-helix protein with protein kinase domain
LSVSYRTGSGRTVRPGKKLAAGAAGAAIAVDGDSTAILKLLDTPTAEDERRLKAMLSIDIPVSVPGASALIAWPTDIVFDAQGNYAGFLMPRAPEPAPVNLSTLALRRERESRVGENLAWDSLLTITASYAAAVGVLHASSVVVCDINLKNVVVSGDLTVTVIDCDSAQVKVGGNTFLSSFCQEEFLAPELRGRNLKQTMREESADRWSLAVLIWMTLMDGHHPFSGVWEGAGEPDRDEHAEAGRFPYAKGAAPLRPSPQAPPWRVLPADLQMLFIAAFTTGSGRPDDRPRAVEWMRALTASKSQLTECRGTSGRHHRFPKGENTCPWCEYETFLNPTREEPRPARVKVVPPQRRAGSAVPRPHPSPSTPVGSPRPPAKGRPRRRGNRSRFLLAGLFVGIIAAAVLLDFANFAQQETNKILGQNRPQRPAPARSIRRHYVDINKGRYHAAFRLMSPRYRRHHHGWLRQVKAARPHIHLIYVGHPRRHRRTAEVPVLFIARDTRDTARSDTHCRRFRGRVHMVKTSRGWRYEPRETFNARVLTDNAPRCP